MQVNFKIEFFSFWHIGSGLSGGTYADGMVLKDSNGLPYVPGKTIKGLFRDAAENIQELSNDVMVSKTFVHQIFGLEGQSNPDNDCFFSSAVLPANLAEEILVGNYQKNLYEVLSSTKLDADGQAADTSLRQLEVCVPLTLVGSIENFPEKDLKSLEPCLKWVKKIGLNRNRGLGRCQISILK